MYQVKNTVSSNGSLPSHSERPLLLQGSNGPGEMGLVLSTDPKPRLKWTTELHERFVDAVSQLGGPDKATPKSVMRVMGVKGLTLYHLKSHLQKYRLGKHLHMVVNLDNNNHGCSAAASKTSEMQGASSAASSMIGTNKTDALQINEAVRMQFEVQRRLHEQIEVQQHLQLRIEAQGKYLQSVLEKARETLAGHNLGSVGLEAARAEISELASKVSSECFNNAFSSLPEMPSLYKQQQHMVQAMHSLNQQSQVPDYSMESCLTSNESFEKNLDRNMQNAGKKRLRTLQNRNVPFWQTETREDASLRELSATQLGWEENLKEDDNFLSSSANPKDSDRNSIPTKGNLRERTTSIRVQTEENGYGMPDAREKQMEVNGSCVGQQAIKPEVPRSFSLQEVCRKGELAGLHRDEDESPSVSFNKLSKLTEELDLNANDDTSIASNCREFDLNGFGWSL